MQFVALIKIGEEGKIQLLDVNGVRLEIGDSCIVETEGGNEFGEVVSEIDEVLDGEAPSGSYKKVLRLATEGDIEQIKDNRQKAEEAFKTCADKIAERELPMKLVDVEYAFDRSRVVFYFTADERVDFRDLVKDLARTFKTRIELRQIGVRDEARRLGGFGPCGRELCCASFLKEFEPVSIRMAKVQNLSLNLSKISGACGRLMCCLGYEQEFYKEMEGKMPKEGTKVKTKYGPGKVVGRNLLKGLVTVETADGKKVEIQWVNE